MLTCILSNFFWCISTPLLYVWVWILWRAMKLSFFFTYYQHHAARLARGKRKGKIRGTHDLHPCLDSLCQWVVQDRDARLPILVIWRKSHCWINKLEYLSKLFEICFYYSFCVNSFCFRYLMNEYHRLNKIGIWQWIKLC